MLNPEELHRVYQQGYLPEHLPDYVEAVSGAESHLIENHLCFFGKNHLLFIGYSLGGCPRDSARAYTAALKEFKPATAAIIAPQLWETGDSFEEQPTDSYYRLDLPPGDRPPGVAYMVRRAGKDLVPDSGKFGREHQKLIKGFVSGHALSDPQKYIFKHIHHYLKRSKTARLLEVRQKGRLAAFTIVDLGSADSAYYLFNFRSARVPVPGASDLLFSEMISLAQAAGKKYINLGLGINSGIRRFKEKWGGLPFLPYASALVRRGTVDLGRLARKL
ncbi:MAG: hypothetical protein V2I56_22780 [Desulfobacteraceae bacterium]|jgi:hypothetical protein|nr:hypothetical protein [Desulfobacteraceae bacterium]